MALLSRLFSSRKNNKPQCNFSTDKKERSSWKPFTFGKDQVRVLLFRECDWRGRKLLFDSSAVQRVTLDNSSCKLRFTSRPKVEKCKKDAYVEVTNGFGYQYTKPSSDATLLGEMMFGAVAMTFRGTALKVHSMSGPNRVMCTKVFPSPVVMHTSRRTSDRSLEDSYGSSVNSMGESCQNSGSESLLQSGPLDVPMGEIAGLKKPSRYNSLEGDSGFCGDFSLQSISSIGSPSYWTPVASPESRNSFGSLCGNKQSGGSLSSLQRRWIRNMSTSLEFGMAQADEGPPCTGQHRRTRLGLAVVISLTEEQSRQMEMFLFEHMSVIESMIERLRFSVERAYLRKETFVHQMHEGWADIQQSLYDMLCTPRLTCPIWLSLTSTENKSHSSLAAMFLQDLCLLVSTLDTKATNFFVSTLVTGVLTHHLGWVNTVWPTNAQSSNSTQNSSATESLNDLLRSHPYNPLWAQLGDLYGALGSPTKIAKTIITSNGRKNDCVNKLLSCMTYFIRCGEVKEKLRLRQDEKELSIETTDMNGVASTSHKPEKLNFFSKYIRKSTKALGEKETNREVLKEQLGKALSMKCPSLDPQAVHNKFPECVVTKNPTLNIVSHVVPDVCNSLISDSEAVCSPIVQELCSFTSNLNSSLHAKSKGNSPSISVCTSCKSPESNRLALCPQIQHSSIYLSVDPGTSTIPCQGKILYPPDALVANENVQLSSFSLSCDTVDEDKPLYTNSPQPQSSDVLETIALDHPQPRLQTSKNELSLQSVCGSDAETSCFYLNGAQKGLSLQLDVVGQEIEQLKELNQFPSHALRGGNFASPAGAEWENENHLTSPSDSGRNSMERELSSDHFDGYAFPNTQSSQRGDGEQVEDFLVRRRTGDRCDLSDNRKGHAVFPSCDDHTYKCESDMLSTDKNISCVKQFQLKRVQSGLLNRTQFKTSLVPEPGEEHKSEHMFEPQISHFCNEPGEEHKSEHMFEPQISHFCNDDGKYQHERTHRPDFEGCEDKSGSTVMKRTSSCISKLSNLTNTSMQESSGSRSSLYPNIDELARMENVLLENECDYMNNLVSQNTCNRSRSGELFETSEDVAEPEMRPKVENLSEAITEKVSKLCRVPTSAVLFHLEPEENESKFTALEAECFEVKRLHSERQLTAVDNTHLQGSKAISMPTFLNLDGQKPREPDVVFVLGDNEELKGLRSNCGSTNVMDSSLADTCRCEFGGDSIKKTNVSDCPFKVRSNCELLNLCDTSSSFVNEPKVIMVKSSYIDLEQESEHLKTNFINVIDVENIPINLSSLNLNTTSAIPRSLSVSLPVSKHKRPKRPSKLVRRHTEKYCDRCKTILKLKSRSRESVPSELLSCQQQSFVSCEKCLCPNLQNSKNFGSLGDYESIWNRLHDDSLKHISKSQDHVDLSVSDTRCKDNVGGFESSLEVDEMKGFSLREDNAIFEQYDPSDEEILGPQTQKAEPKIHISQEIGYKDLQVVELPLPSCESGDFEVVGLAASLLGGISARYVPDLVLQGCSMLPLGWEASLRRDLNLTAKLPLLGQDVTEAVCIVANTHTWEVQLVSSHAYVVDKPGTFGVCVGMSQLVANMLESLVHLWKLKIPPENCLLHLESKLQELYLRSQALAELLLTTEFCNMEFLTTSLDLEANDVPLLLAVASTHSPQIAHRYGLSFC